jgi:hypothetical protein
MGVSATVEIEIPQDSRRRIEDILLARRKKESPSAQVINKSVTVSALDPLYG